MAVTMRDPMFPVGAFIFAKMKGFKPWPARIKEIRERSDGVFRYYVRFYGTYDYYECQESELYPYNQRVKERNIVKGPMRKKYIRSIKEIEEDLALQKERCAIKNKVVSTVHEKS